MLCPDAQTSPQHICQSSVIGAHPLPILHTRNYAGAVLHQKKRGKGSIGSRFL